MLKAFIYFSLLTLSGFANEISPEQLLRQKSEWWSLQQPVKAVPENKDNWCKTDIDFFILRALQKKSLTPSKQASKRILIRRAYYNLTGLPPTSSNVDAFLKDNSLHAYGKLIDHLLTKKEYGEKWARHWMDVARFADTKGFLPANRDQKYPFSYTYRDYLIRAFNTDKPYTDFIMEQLAADQIDLKDKRDLAALGFQTAGDHFLGRREEIINDRIDVTTQGFLGLTVACARCHDHKFDPIPTADYYSLYGVFNASSQPKTADLPIISYPKNKKAYAIYQQKYDNLNQEKKEIETEYRAGFFEDWQEVAPDYLNYIARSIGGEKDLKMIDGRGRQMRRQMLNDVKQLLIHERKKDAFFGLWNKFLRASGVKIPALVQAALKNPQTATLLKKELIKLPKHTKESLFKLYERLFKKVIAEKKDYQKIYHSFAGSSFKTLLEKNEVIRYASNAEDDKIIKINNKISSHLASKGSPARAMVVEDTKKPASPYIFIRGKKSSRGDTVDRRFLQALSYKKSQEKFTKGNGRLELAESIADEKNPLTARVLVNRVWKWHFGRGLVDTPSNFGLLGSKPSHPELLDYLAVWFMENGWSLKKLNKLIMTSAVYKQQSNSRPSMKIADGANTYLWKMNRRRLSWEELRDSVVQTTGKLKAFGGGEGVPLLLGQYQPYRTIYGYLKRDSISGAAKAFDFPAAEITCESRSKTIVPQQGLFLMNSPFMLRSSRMIVGPLKGNTKAKIDEIFKRVYGRAPKSKEMKFSQDFLAQANNSFKESALPEWLFGYAILNEQDHLQKLTEFAFFNKVRRQVSKVFPHKKAGHAVLTEKGGHPGRNKLAVVRRCKLNRTGKLSIKSWLKHPSEKGDGVRALVMHNGVKIGEWNCQYGSVLTVLENVSVVAGDVIDFVVDAKKSTNSDAFTWPVEMAVSVASSNEKVPIPQDFKKEQKSQNYSAWHGLAQVLMMSNEFLYVD